MSQHDARKLLTDMASYARDGVNCLDGVDEAAFMKNRTVQLAVTRAIEVVGEAAKRLGPDFHASHPELPWREIIRMRDLLAHGYDVIELERIWGTATKDLPTLMTQVERILRDEFGVTGDNV